MVRVGVSKARVGEVSDERMRQWLAAVTMGDRQAFFALYQAFLPRVHGYLRLQVSNDSDVQDLLQDTFVTVWRSADRYSGSSTVATWIFGIARHKLLDWLRAKQKLRQLEFEMVDADEVQAYSQQDFADVIVSKLDLSEALRALPSIYAELFYLVFQESMSYRDIGVLLEIPEGTVKSRMHQAKILLRQQLRKEGDAIEQGM